MSLLTKKMQQGGSLFADTKNLDFGARDLMGLFKEDTTSSKGNRRYYPSTKASSTTNNSNNSIKDGLPSDIQFYNMKSKEIDMKIKSIMEGGVDADETAAYEQAIQEKYDLEASIKPQIKTLNKLFATSKTKYNSESAGDTPAILEGHALVEVNDAETPEEQYAVIPVKDLLMNADKYTVLSSSTAFSKRVNDWKFNGFNELGQFANRLIDEAYGSESFSKYMNRRMKELGYQRAGGSIKTPGGIRIDLNDIKFDADGHLRTKMNIGNLDAVVEDLLNNQRSKAYSYMYNRALEETYFDVKNGSLDPKKLGDAGISKEIGNRMIRNLWRYLKGSIVVDEDKDGKNGSNSGGGLTLSDQLKAVKRNVYNVTAYKLLSGEKKGIEVTPGIDKESKAGSIYYNTNAVEIPKGGTLLNNGYELKSTNDDEEPHYDKRILKNNQTINNIIGGNAMVSTVNGIPITEIVEDKNEEWITTPKDSRMYMLIAPIETLPNGKEVVNFENNYYRNMPTIIAKVYKKLHDKGINPEDAASGKYAKELKEAVEEISSELQASGGIPEGTHLGIAISFDTILNLDSDYNDPSIFPYAKDATKHEDDFLYNIESNYFNRNTKRVRVFAPVGEGFWNVILSPNAFGKEAEVDFNVADWIQTTSKKYSKDVSSPSNKDFEKFSKKEASKYDGYADASDVKSILTP